MMMIPGILFIFGYLYVIFAVVPESTERFFCQDGLQVLKLKNASRAINCEQSWTADSTPIASFIAGSAECHHPCINVTAGEIIIRGCVNVTLSNICSQGYVTESRIHYLGIQNHLPLKENKRASHHYGICAFAVLLLVISVAFSIQCCKSQPCRMKNTGPNHV